MNTMRERSIQIIFGGLVLLGIGIAIWWWPPRPQPLWNDSSTVLVLELASHALEGGTYMPSVQIWGDGRIVWWHAEANGTGRFLEGKLSRDALRHALDRVIEAGTFDPMVDLGGGVVFQYLYVNLRNQQRCVHNTDDRMERIIQADPELLHFLRTGAGLHTGQAIVGLASTTDCR
jgi:hypothetical protein